MLKIWLKNQLAGRSRGRSNLFARTNSWVNRNYSWNSGIGREDRTLSRQSRL